MVINETVGGGKGIFVVGRSGVIHAPPEVRSFPGRRRQIRFVAVRASKARRNMVRYIYRQRLQYTTSIDNVQSGNK